MWYYGRKWQHGWALTIFKSAETPTEETHGDQYDSVAGPYRTRKEINAAALEYQRNSNHIVNFRNAVPLRFPRKPLTVGELRQWEMDYDADVQATGGEFITVTDGQDIPSIREAVDRIRAYDSYLVIIKDGDYVVVYGCEGMPWSLSKVLHRLK